jgi:hypothetical protein
VDEFLDDRNTMTPQAAILEPLPEHARHLFFDLQDGCFGRECDNNDERDDAPTSAHVKRALFGFTQPLAGGYDGCPPMRAGGVDLQALGL